jgi:hypothetical protein
MKSPRETLRDLAALRESVKARLDTLRAHESHSKGSAGFLSVWEIERTERFVSALDAAIEYVGRYEDLCQ